MFAIGDLVVYGSNGICQVRDIAPVDIPGASSERMYYYLSPVGAKESRIYSPVDNVRVVMRHVLTQDEARAILDGIDEIPELELATDKLMELKYKEVIASCDVKQLIGMIKTIKSKQVKRQQEGKKITATDERYLKKAEEGLVNELGIALSMEKDAVRDLLMNN